MELLLLGTYHASILKSNNMKDAFPPNPVANFPPWFPWYKKLGGNITYWLSQIPLWRRKNNLTRTDIKQIWNQIQTWDILLVGNFIHISGLFIDWVVTHALSYTGKWRCIHAFAHGVSYIGLQKVIRHYDTAIILRPYWKWNEAMTFRNSLIQKLWTPYDFYFWLDEKENDAYFCSQLINDSLQEIGYKTHLASIRNTENILDEVLDKTFRGHRILLPDTMIYGNFEIIFHSHNIQKEGGKYVLTKNKLLM